MASIRKLTTKLYCIASGHSNIKITNLAYKEVSMSKIAVFLILVVVSLSACTKNSVPPSENKDSIAPSGTNDSSPPSENKAGQLNQVQSDNCIILEQNCNDECGKQFNSSAKEKADEEKLPVCWKKCFIARKECEK